MKSFKPSNHQLTLAIVTIASLLSSGAAFGGQMSQTLPVSTELPVGTTFVATNSHAASHDDGHQEGSESDSHHMSAGHHREEEVSFGHPAKAEQADRTIKIEAVDIAFKPQKVTVHKGETIKFVVKNTGKLQHEFVLGTPDEQKEHAKEMQAMRAKGGHMEHHDPNAITIPAGETKTLTWTFTKTVPVTYACHEPGHYQAGMVGDVEIQ